MTTEHLIDLYMARRRELLEAGTPLEGWIVCISPADAEVIREEQSARINPMDFVGMVYGALWTIDARVEPGQIRIDLPK